MYRYIKSSYFEKPHPYPYGSQEFKDIVQEHVKHLSDKYSDATIQNFNGIIYVISPKIGVDMYVVDEWGHCGKLYGGFFDYVQDYLKDGGDINLVTFTDDAGNVYTPYKNRKSINVTFPNGSSVDLPRGKAETLYLHTNKQGFYNDSYKGTPLYLGDK
jgi:hypothetical protein